MRPLISAHQGGRRVDGVPAAERYRNAIALGVDFVEFDVRRTKDGATIICHDDFTVSGRVIRSFAYRELTEELGSEAMTFEELLDVAAGKVGLHLDLKETGYEAAIVGAVLDRCALDQFVITSGDAAIRTIKEQFPQVRAGLSVGDDLTRVLPWRRIGGRLSELFPRRRLERCHADFVAVHKQIAGLTVLGYCARQGIPAWVWTVDDETAIARFLRDPRVTALITNRPDIALRLRRALRGS
ncbi:MAG: glycerophosphodiester phosphodiesterase [Candidatus Dormibacteraeota bacterium]|nr:glycerophosphodiester phosphodiesterase [Candidatus Dormibacteraeota bacterium]